jgi:hypothetical protein
LSFEFGKVVFPVPTAPTHPSLLASCDPSLAKLLDFLQYMITTYVGDALMTAAGLPTSAPITAAVAQVVPINPSTIAKAEQWQFPMLAGWRQSAKNSDRTLNWRQDTSTVGIAYILPPLSPAQSITLQPVLTAISHICNYALRQGSDPGYNAGEQVIRDNLITRARLMSGEWGAYNFDNEGKAYWSSWLGEIELVEQTEPYTVGLDPLDGSDVVISQQDSDAAVPIDIVRMSTSVG